MTFGGGMMIVASIFGGRVLAPLAQMVAQWREAKSADVPALAATIAQWQRGLWRFTTVGHIGKRNGPKAWQVPVTPLAQAVAETVAHFRAQG
mgnify:CR=1 FL=1